MLHTLLTVVLAGLLDIPVSEDVLFALAVFAAAIAVLFRVHPEVVLGAAFFYAILTFVDLLGPSPFLALMVLIIAALARLAVEGVLELWDLPPETLASLAAVLEPLLSRGGDDRENG